MSDETTACPACERLLRSLQNRKVELNHQLDTLEFQMAAIKARLEEVEDLLEVANEPPAPKRGRPKGGKPIVVATEAPLLDVRISGVSAKLDTPLLDQTA